jgi:hypothetical protein
MTTLSITRPRGWRLRSGVLAFTLALFVPLAIPATATASSFPSGSNPWGYVPSGNIPSVDNWISLPQRGVFVNDVSADAPADGNNAFNAKFQLGIGVTPKISAYEDATAVTQCANCSAIALGLQVVTTTDTYLTTIRAQGIASATNTVCTPSCTAVADAYQVVVATNTPSPLGFGTLLSGQQLAQLWKVRNEFLALPTSGDTIPQILSECQDLVNQVDSILLEATYRSTFPSFFMAESSPAIHGVATATEQTPSSSSIHPTVQLYHYLQFLPSSTG